MKLTRNRIAYRAYPLPTFRHEKSRSVSEQLHKMARETRDRNGHYKSHITYTSKPGSAFIEQNRMSTPDSVYGGRDNSARIAGALSARVKTPDIRLKNIVAKHSDRR